MNERMVDRRATRARRLGGHVLALLAILALAVSPIVPSAAAEDPLPTPTTDPAAPTPAPLPTPDPTLAATPAPIPEPTVAPVPGSARATHVWIDLVAQGETAVQAGGIDAWRLAAERFTVYIVRFQVLNDGDVTAVLSPALLVGSGVDPSSFTELPLADTVPGRPFFGAIDEGPGYRARVEAVEVADLRLRTSPDAAATPVAGTVVWGVTAPTLTLEPHRFTEVAFAVRATVDARWLADYTLRLSGDGVAAGGQDARLTMRSKPAPALSPGQRSGRLTDPAVRYPLDLASYLKAKSDARKPGAGRARIAAAASLSYALVISPSAPFTSPHTLDTTLAGDACAACHQTHTAKGQMLQQQPEPQSNQCFTCHDGSGALSNIQSQYTDVAVPTNDPATARYYSHPATGAGASAHVSDRGDEFGGASDRHASCADCHQPHRADATLPEQTTGGWTVSGANIGASGVAVVNGAAGTEPTYAWLRKTELEYQLCFKCHSGWTTLPAQDPSHPSRWALDKGVELNPANLSTHPIEGKGTNQTLAMTNSLAGTSPFKQWTFTNTSTVRCVNCHGDSRAYNLASPPAQGSNLAPHAVAYPGILIRNYRNGDLYGTTSTSYGLKTSSQGYAAADFALCYLCHAEQPFVDSSGDPLATTNFSYHGKHTYGLAGKGSGGRDIEVAGAGQGNALCAECHYRIHSTAYSLQTPWTRLVSFSPNVLPYGANPKPIFNAAASTCTLTCHGYQHNNKGY